ncbi:MAG: hypothetical protein NVSMB64_21190 [Candidatus Velthaea sp.]
MHPDESAEYVGKAIATIEIDVRRLMSGDPVRDLPTYASKMERAFAAGDIRVACDHASMVMALLDAYQPTRDAAAPSQILRARAIEIDETPFPYDGRGDPLL